MRRAPRSQVCGGEAFAGQEPSPVAQAVVDFPKNRAHALDRSVCAFRRDPEPRADQIEHHTASSPEAGLPRATARRATWPGEAGPRFRQQLCVGPAPRSAGRAHRRTVPRALRPRVAARHRADTAGRRRRWRPHARRCRWNRRSGGSMHQHRHAAAAVAARCEPVEQGHVRLLPVRAAQPGRAPTAPSRL